jgi:hypothetical protein
VFRQDIAKADPALPSFWPSIAAASAQLCARPKAGFVRRVTPAPPVPALRIVTRRKRGLR